MAGFRWPYRIRDIARIWPEMDTPRGRQVGRWEQMIALLELRDRSIEDFLNTSVGGGGKEYATVIVAAVDSHQSGKDSADFVGTGAGDESVLQDAVDSLPTIGGFKVGHIELLEGSFAGSGDVTITDGFVWVSGQGETSLIGATNLTGINFVGAGSLSVLGLRDLALFGNVSGFTILDLEAMSVFGNIAVGTLLGVDVILAGTLTFTNGLSLADTTLSNVGSSSLSGVSSGQTLTLHNVTTSMPIDVTGAGTSLDIDGLMSLDTITTVGALLVLRSFIGGKVVGASFPADAKVPHIQAVNTENVEFRGRSGRIAASDPNTQVEFVESGGTSHNNTLIGYAFEGNAEQSSGVGGTTCHVTIGAGVSGTKLVNNYYGGASVGNVCDSGTDTVTDDTISTTLTTGAEAGLFWMGAGHRESTGGSSGCGSCAADESLLWMQSANTGPSGPAGAQGAAGASADESLVWMFSGTGPRGDTGAAGAAGSSGDESLVWMGAGHRQSTPVDPPLKGVVVTRAVQSINNATQTDISYDTEVEDSSGFFAPTSTTVTIPTGEGGIYALSLRAGINAAATGRSLISIVANGIIWRAPFGAGEDNVAIGVTVRLPAGATITTPMFQTSGGTRNLNARFEVWKIGT